MNPALIILALLAVTAHARPLTPIESNVCLMAAVEHRLTGPQTALLLRIAQVENGRPGAELGVESRHARRFAGRADGMSFWEQAQHAAGIIVRRGYRDARDMRRFAQRWCPVNKRNWVAMVENRRK